MYNLSGSPVAPVTLGQASKISLDHYYDLLKSNAAGLQADEYLQLKITADVVDISTAKASEGGYAWFSQYAMLQRADREIVPTAVSGEIQTGAGRLSDVYSRFLRRLRGYVVKRNLSPDEQKEIANLDVREAALTDEMRRLGRLDRQMWYEECEILGYDYGDTSAYVQWSNYYGYVRDIERLNNDRNIVRFERQTIINRQYGDPDDQAIVDAENAFYTPGMRLRYPIWPDHQYPSGDSFSVGYLGGLMPGSTAQFDDRHAISWDPALGKVPTVSGGGFSANLTKSSGQSSSISTDWSGSASAKYGFVSVRAGASESKKIQKDFDTSTGVEVAAKAAFKIKLLYPAWFNVGLFNNLRLRENIRDFADFLGPGGSLLYYPTALVVVRGFSVKFSNNQNWSYDYKRNFSAKGGGGFKAFGVKFGGSSSYSKNVKEHKVDKSSTKLTFSDDENTVRFVGYVVKRNTIYEDELNATAADILSKDVVDALSQ